MKAASFARLQSLRMDNTQRGYDLADMRPRFAALATRHEDGTAPRAVAAFNLFQTPEHVATRMAAIAAAHLQGNPAPVILEPSAGLGRIARALFAAIPAARVHLIDNAPDCCQELRRIARDGDRVRELDFIETAPEELPTVDAVVMNPPFKLGRDIRHIRHALATIRPGGLLVALCYNGTRQNDKLRPECDTWEVLPENTFAREGTGASVALLTISKK